MTAPNITGSSVSGSASTGAPSAFVAESRVGFTPIAQGVYFVATGLWPILHLRSFQWVTGRKTEGWLVKTFGALLTSVGGALIQGAVEAPRSRTLRALGIGSAAALGLADFVYAAKGRVSRVYLADMVIQAGLVASWLLEERAHRTAEKEAARSEAP